MSPLNDKTVTGREVCVRAPVRVCSCRQEWMTTAFLKLYAAIYSTDFLEEGEKGEGSGGCFSSPSCLMSMRKLPQIFPHCSINSCILFDGGNADSDRFSPLCLLFVIIFSLLFHTTSLKHGCWVGCRILCHHWSTTTPSHHVRLCCTLTRAVCTLAWPVGVPAELTSPPIRPHYCWTPPLPVQPLPLYVELSSKQASPTWPHTKPVLQHYIICRDNVYEKVALNQSPMRQVQMTFLTNTWYFAIYFLSL